MGAKYEPKPVSAAELNTSLIDPPLSAVTPPAMAAAPTTGASAALAPSAVPTMGINAGANMAMAGSAMGAMNLTTFLTPSQSFLNMLNSGKPVAGLMVPEPPCSYSICASSGVTCASMVSP